jgi:predicted tellurium resistance membrane protein TerC
MKRLTGACVFTLTGLVFAVIGLFNWTNLTENMSNDSAVIPMIFGGLFLAIGISLFVVFFVGRKMLAKEIEAEEKALENK